VVDEGKREVGSRDEGKHLCLCTTRQRRAAAAIPPAYAAHPDSRKERREQRKVRVGRRLEGSGKGVS